MKSTPETRVPGIHPRFYSSIPDLIESAQKTRNILEPVIAGATSLVAEVRVYLQYEIDRVVVAIKKAEWEERSDVTAAKSHLEDLKAFERLIEQFDMQAQYAALGLIAEGIRDLSSQHPP